VTTAVLFAIGFLVMEPLAYAAHRWVMHGIAWVIHRTHHRQPDGPLELNDLFPLVFASLTVLMIAAGVSYPDLSPLVPLGAGITVYGVIYAFLHDVYFHQRLPFPWRFAVLDYLKEAHRIHHLFAGEPYGMLFPFVPKELWARAQGIDRDPLARGRVRA
jgi:beta-carotene 3-hydroxylase